MLHEGLYFLAMLVITLSLLKVTAAWLLHHDANSGLGKAIDWVLTPA